MARRWVDEGGECLHVVDLDGAREGAPRNFTLVKAIAETVSVPVQTGGGIRAEKDLLALADSKVATAVLGTSAVEDPRFVERALAVLGPERLVIAVDAEDGFVKTKGWVERTEIRAQTLAEGLAAAGVRVILYTDISRDGMMRRANVEGIREVAEGSGLEVLASGGVTDLDDLKELKELESCGVTGVIVGRALYEERFTVEQARAVLD